jgi:hypothetical protein
VVEEFQTQEVDGEALIECEEAELKSELKCTQLGPRKKLMNKITAARESEATVGCNTDRTPGSAGGVAVGVPFERGAAHGAQAALAPHGAEAVLKTASTLKLAGNDLLAGGQHAKAHAVYTKAYEEAALLPESKDRTLLCTALLCNRALCSVKMGNGPSALEDSNTALGLDQSCFKARYRRGQALKQMEQHTEGDYDIATATFQEKRQKEMARARDQPLAPAAVSPGHTPPHAPSFAHSYPKPTEQGRSQEKEELRATMKALAQERVRGQAGSREQEPQEPQEPAPRLGWCRVCAGKLRSETAVVHVGCKEAEAGAAAAGTEGGAAAAGSEASAELQNRPSTVLIKQQKQRKTSVVLNIANIGHYCCGPKFDWDNVRAVYEYYDSRGVVAFGVLKQGTAHRNPVPPELCARITISPNRDGQRDLDDLFCLRTAQEKGCQYVDNDNYRDWQEKADQDLRSWMDHTKSNLHVSFVIHRQSRPYDFVPEKAPLQTRAAGAEDESDEEVDLTQLKPESGVSVRYVISCSDRSGLQGAVAGLCGDAEQARSLFFQRPADCSFAALLSCIAEQEKGGSSAAEFLSGPGGGGGEPDGGGGCTLLYDDEGVCLSPHAMATSLEDGFVRPGELFYVVQLRTDVLLAAEDDDDDANGWAATSSHASFSTDGFNCVRGFAEQSEGALSAFCSCLYVLMKRTSPEEKDRLLGELWRLTRFAPAVRAMHRVLKLQERLRAHDKAALAAGFFPLCAALNGRNSADATAAAAAAAASGDSSAAAAAAAAAAATAPAAQAACWGSELLAASPHVFSFLLCGDSMSAIPGGSPSGQSPFADVPLVDSQTNQPLTDPYRVLGTPDKVYNIEYLQEAFGAHGDSGLGDTLRAEDITRDRFASRLLARQEPLRSDQVGV